jgi:hypothetical protein
MKFNVISQAMMLVMLLGNSSDSNYQYVKAVYTSRLSDKLRDLSSTYPETKML